LDGDDDDDAAAADGVAGFEEGVEVDFFSVSMTNNGFPGLTMAPALPKVLTIVPASGAVISCPTFSVSNDKTTWSLLAKSPSFKSHDAIFPSVTESPKLGTLTVISAKFLRGRCRMNGEYVF